MALEDGFERAGIVLGSVVLVPLPMLLLADALVGADHSSWFWPTLVLAGLLVGVAIAREWIPIDYRDLWYVSVVGAVLTGLVWFELGLLTPSAQPVYSTVTWALSLGVAAVLSRVRLGRLLPD